MRRYVVILLLCTVPVLLSAQTLTGDSILANERAIDRPITLHKSQIRITGTYDLSFLSSGYDLYGETVPLYDDGSSSTKHRYVVDLRYGVNDHIQFTAAIAHVSHVVRQETEYILPTGTDPVVAHDVTIEYSGFQDLFLAVDLRAPLNTRKYDLALTLAAILPVAPFEPPTPDHSFEHAQTDGVNTHKFFYRYKYPPGKGITRARVGAMAKYRLSRFAFSGRVDYQHGLSEGESFEWRHQLNSNGSFDYRKDPFNYRLPDLFSYFAEIEYQPRPRWDIFLNVSGHTAYRGWTESQENVKVAIPYQNSWVASPGFEILLTPKLWVREKLNFPLAGRSYEAPFSLETSLLYNFFPFK